MAEREVQRRLAAIVSADVVAYTRLMERDEVGTHARLRARFTELVEPKIAEHGGRVVKLMGDGPHHRRRRPHPAKGRQS